MSSRELIISIVFQSVPPSQGFQLSSFTQGVGNTEGLIEGFIVGFVLRCIVGLFVGTTEGLLTGERQGCRKGEAESAPKLTVKETGPAVSINPLLTHYSFA